MFSRDPRRGEGPNQWCSAVALPGDEGGEMQRGGVEFPCHRREMTPACRGRGLGDTPYKAQDGLYLLSRAPRDVGTE